MFRRSLKEGKVLKSSGIKVHHTTLLVSLDLILLFSVSVNMSDFILTIHCSRKEVMFFLVIARRRMIVFGRSVGRSLDSNGKSFNELA